MDNLFVWIIKAVKRFNLPGIWIKTLHVSVFICYKKTCKVVHKRNISTCFLAAPQKSLGEEVNELTSSRLLKLEKDNQALLKTVEELRGAASQDTVTKLAKVNQENQKLHQKVNNDCAVVGSSNKGWKQCCKSRGGCIPFFFPLFDAWVPFTKRRFC